MSNKRVQQAPKSHKVMLTLDPETWKAVELYAEAVEQPVASVVRMILQGVAPNLTEMASVMIQAKQGLMKDALINTGKTMTKMQLLGNEQQLELFTLLQSIDSSEKKSNA